jgi:hypothetical protein
MVHHFTMSPEVRRTPLNAAFSPELPVRQAENLSSEALPSEALAPQCPPLSQLSAQGSDLHLHQKVLLSWFYSFPFILILSARTIPYCFVDCPGRASSFSVKFLSLILLPPSLHKDSPQKSLQKKSLHTHICFDL